MTLIDWPSETVLVNPIKPHIELLEEDIPTVIHLPGALSDDYCDRVAAALRTLVLTPYEATVGSDQFAPIPKMGAALFEFHDEMAVDARRGLDHYFKQAEYDSARLRGLFCRAGVADPLDVLHYVADQLLGGPVKVASEGGREYFSGVVRDIDGGAIPHYDDASIDTPLLAVGQTRHQSSILFYLTDFVGGALTSYDKKPTAEDNKLRQLGYGYTWEAVQGSHYAGVAPRKGSIIAFNPRFLHSVAPILDHQRRLTFSAFVGRSVESGDLVSWS